jgi:hypothetical protein
MALLAEILYLFLLTIRAKSDILTTRTFPAQEVMMSDEKLRALRQSRTLHPHPEQVRDPLFTSGSPFFDPRDLVQVKYELLRRVRVDGYAVSQATALFALSRPTFYAAQSAWVRETHPPMAAPEPAQALAHRNLSPLLTLVAAMIAEVCP